MDDILSFTSLVFLSAGLGIDNGLLIEFSIKSLNLSKSKHLFWRSITLFLAALLRIGMLFILSSLSFLENPLPDSMLYLNRLFSENPGELNWMSLVLFMGGVIILIMAIWEYYHKIREELSPHKSQINSQNSASLIKVVYTIFYLLGMNILFSLDSVFASVAILDIKTQFAWIVAAIVIASVIMIFGMIPISAIISRNKHFGVLMLSILAVIGTKLLVDGTGSHFSNALLMFIIFVLLVNDAAQGLIDWASNKNKPIKSI